MEIKKERSAKSFSQKCENYKKVALIQNRVHTKLLEALSANFPKPRGTWLDVGSGPGIISSESLFNNCNLINFDIAEKSLQFAKIGGLKNSSICGDMDYLPLKKNSLDGVISSSALQWSSDTALAISSFLNLIKRGGILALAVFTEGTLSALNKTQFSFNITPPTQFISSSILTKTIKKQNSVFYKNETLFDNFKTPTEAVRSITAIGTGNTTEKKLSQKELASFIKSFAKNSKNYREDNSEIYQNSYNISFIILEKK